LTSRNALNNFTSSLLGRCDLGHVNNNIAMSSASVGKPLSYLPAHHAYPVAQEKANLARIRDNQRRSRARRKEYLQELEARLRQCELHGIEASAEIQLAARKVADENRKLRELLSLHGIREDSVEGYLQSSQAGDALLSSQYPSRSTPVQALQHMLQARKPYFTDVQAGQPDRAMTASDSPESSLTSVNTTQSPWDLDRLSSSDTLHPSGKAASHQIMTPSSTSRSTTSSISHNSHHSGPHHQRLAPVPLPRNPTPTSRVNHAQMFDLDPQLSSSDQIRYISNQSTPRHLPAHGTPQSPYMPTTTSCLNVNSCVFATDMITTMTGADPNSVNAELGCLPGMDCDVDNQLVFNVMDRYSGGETVGI
jgi:hypothetical protein